MNYTIKLAAVVICGLLGDACSSSNSSDAPAVPLDQYPQQYASVLCDTIAPCCDSAGIQYNALTCKSAVTQDYTERVQQSSGPYTKYDAQAAGNCLSALKSALQSCKSFESAKYSGACLEVFTGSQPAGAACVSSADCADNGYCNPSADGTTATCTRRPTDATNPEPHGKAGDACVGDCFTSSGLIECASSGVSSTSTTAYCYDSDSLYCSSSSQTCIALAAIGAPCPDGECVSGAFCDPDRVMCVAQRDSGSCAASADACSAKSYCDSSAEQCFAKKPDGYSCADDLECVSHRCSDTGASSSGTCGAGSAATEDSCSGQL